MISVSEVSVLTLQYYAVTVNSAYQLLCHETSLFSGTVLQCAKLKFVLFEVFNMETEFNSKNKGRLSDRLSYWDELFGPEKAYAISAAYKVNTESIWKTFLARICLISCLVQLVLDNISFKRLLLI